MNSAIISQILYIFCMIFSIGLTIAGSFTSGWRYTGDLESEFRQYIPNGLFPSQCFNNRNKTDLQERCIDWLKVN
uniref:Uncharacterized protein n=1 Tax=Panagrolaimus superbus TaxID=310955 RepID=A0A914Y9E0_9BILA